jgi:hypothetical protein
MKSITEQSGMFPCIQVILAKRLVRSASATKASSGIAKKKLSGRCPKILYAARRSTCIDAERRRPVRLSGKRH